MSANLSSGSKCGLFLVTALVLPRPLLATSTQDTVRVGDSSVSGEFIRPFRIQWIGIPRTAEGATLATFTVDESVEIVDGNLLKFVQAWNDTLGNNLFTSARVADRATMGYRAFHTGASPGGLGHLDFDGKRVTGMFAESAEQAVTTIGLVLDEEVFASFAGLLFAAFPLRDGYEAVMPGFGWGGSTNPALRWQTLRVVGRERISVAGSGMMDAFVAESSRQSGVQFWLSKSAPYFLKAVAPRGEGGTTTFVVGEWEYLD